MRDWSLLKRRLSELRLRPYLRLVANLLIEGRTTREIATMIGCPQQEVKLKVAAIFYHLSRLPPDASESEILVRPSPGPLKPGHALRLSPAESGGCSYARAVRWTRGDAAAELRRCASMSRVP